MKNFTNFTKMLMLTSCVVILHGTAGVTDDDFTPYVKEFERVCNVHSGSIINFGNKFEKNVIGFCTPGNKNVRINRRFWDMADSYEREWLIFHELGHCDLNREHRDGFREDPPKFIPLSIMATEMFNVNIYMTHRAYYIKELCEKR